MAIKDSGERRNFESGAVRDITEGKGRCDLLPLRTIGFIENDSVLKDIDKYVRTGNKFCIVKVIKTFSEKYFGDLHTAMLEVSKHYEEGCNKYGERNWEKGIPLHCYIDSGTRHYLKHLRGDTDEPHDRAFLWNMLGAIWTHDNHPEMVDLPFASRPQVKKEEDTNEDN